MNTKQIIDSAYRFEIASIESNSTTRNPHYDTIMQMENGEALWEVVNVMVESYIDHRKQYEELERFADKVCVAYDDMEHTIDIQAAEIERLRALVDDLRDEIIYLNDVMYTY